MRIPGRRMKQYLCLETGEVYRSFNRSSVVRKVGEPSYGKYTLYDLDERRFVAYRNGWKVGTFVDLGYLKAVE